MLFPRRDSELFRDLFLFADGDGAAASAGGADAGGGASGGAPAASGSEGAAAGSETPATPVADEKTPEASNDGNAKPGEGEKPAEGEGKDPPANETPAAKAIREGVEAGIKARQPEIDAAIAEGIKAASKSEREVSDAEQSKAVVEASVTNIANAFKGLKIDTHDADGNPVALSLTDAGITQAGLRKHIEEMQNGLGAIEEARIYDELAEGALAKLANDEVRERFTEKAAGKDLETWADEFAEAAAPSTRWAQHMQATRDADIAAAKAEGAREAEEFFKNAPGGTPSSRSSASPAGALTPAEFLAMSKDERARAWRERPAEVNAL